ncbi:hypothetical protein B9Z55_008758 [Caenorhabditis nigoni]|uniref:Uncharacterized protein n=1 Tax=Caenorhabditis nigoni TaxID=1611254 RepID=A0A2G5UP52_9PELO|nr:hypothetical protein B9Z55_008758 [Caenorhabditis nigoni]
MDFENSGDIAFPVQEIKEEIPEGLFDRLRPFSDMPEIDYFGPKRRKTADLQKMTPEASHAYKKAINRNATRNYQNRKRAIKLE